MYIDLIILLAIVILAIFFFKSFRSFVYSVCLTDIFLRLMRFLAVNLKFHKSSFIYKLPESFAGCFVSYMKSPLSDIFIWLIFICYVCFLYYSTIYLFTKRRGR